MPEYDVEARLIGRRYACDECGEEMLRDKETNRVLSSVPPQYPSICSNGHRANLRRSYPAYDVQIDTQDAAR